MAALTVDFRKHSGPTPADDTAAQIITDYGNFTLDFKPHRLCAFPLFLQTLGPWFPNEMQNLLSSEKRTLDSPVIFLLFAQVRCFWRCFCFRSGLVALFLKMFRCPVHSLWSSPKCLTRLCLTVFSSLRSSLFLVHIFLPNFFLPANFAFNMLWFSTPWTAIPFRNDPLWLTLFVEGVNDRLLGHYSRVPHYCGFKVQEIPTIYIVLLMGIYWNSNVNILIFWDTDFWLSLAVSSNHQNKKLLKCFTLNVMNLKYMTVSLFEISYNKKINFLLLFSTGGLTN